VPWETLGGRKPRRASTAVFRLTLDTACTDSLEDKTPEGGGVVGGRQAAGNRGWPETDQDVTTGGDQAPRGVLDSSEGKALEGKTPGVQPA
jgi:hypothetical protein